VLKERPFREEVVMTAQQAPPPMWRKFLSLPHARLGWWAVGLASIALIVFALPDPERAVSPPWLGVALAILRLITLLVAPLAGGVVGSLAVGAGERSLLVWFAQVPAAPFFAVLASIFQENPLWVGLSVGVLVWAVIAFSLIYLRSQGRSS
jgi:hypothetical protein